MNDENNLKQKASELLSEAGFSLPVGSISPCTRGGNNRTFILETPERRFLLKEYFRQPGDNRNRLQAEFSFLKYAQHVATGMVPEAYAKDDESGLALYEFVVGDAFTRDGLTKDDVFQAAGFFVALNQNSDSSSRSRVGHIARDCKEQLPNASESCFSINEHLSLVGDRVARLAQIPVAASIDEQACSVVRELDQHWDMVRQGVITTAKEINLSLDEKLARENRCISPSDFGFHNALKRSDGAVCFLDFEYAGWDDPAKMVGDFFSQLAVPVPQEYYKQFIRTVMRPFPATNELEQRALLLKNVYQIKWCCIAMNVFFPTHLERRKFANPDLNVLDLKSNQLAKAQTLIQKMETCHYV